LDIRKPIRFTDVWSVTPESIIGDYSDNKDYLLLRVLGINGWPRWGLATPLYR